MYCIGVSYKKTKAEIREKFNFSDEEKNVFIPHVLEKTGLEGCVILSTCNRSELYFSGNVTDGIEVMEKFLHEFKNIDLNTVKEECLAYAGENAIRHLFNVCCGMDSMVLGEVEIIRQIKEAYGFSFEHKWVNKELNIVFQAALNSSKEIHNKTNLAYCPVSVSTLTAKAVEKYCKENGRNHILIIGAGGRTGSIVIKNLLDMNIDGIEIVGTGRNPETLKSEYENYVNVRIEDYKDRYAYVDWADVIVSATSSPHYTFVSDKCADLIKNNKLFIDLAIPRDIDKDIADNDKVSLMDIDYFNKLAKKNNEAKIAECDTAYSLIEEKVQKTVKNIAFEHYITENDKLHKELENRDSMWLIHKLRDELDKDSFIKIIEILGDYKDGIFSTNDRFDK